MKGFFEGKRVLVTGHTGFKGSWLCLMLISLGARVTGFSLHESPTEPGLYPLLGLKNEMEHLIGDVRDREKLREVVAAASPDVVFHLAAQPLVLEGYQKPCETFETNIMGTVNLLDALRTERTPVRSIVVVTTDKVYLDRGYASAYREQEPLGGFDPYAASKSCADLVAQSYRNSFFDAENIAVSTVRAGNVLGGGDFADNRILPDCVRAAVSRRAVVLRNPHAVRPYQHVLEPLNAYLLLAARQHDDAALADGYNIGPAETDCITTRRLAELFCAYWGEDMTWRSENQDGPHEAAFLKLDCEKVRQALMWRPRWTVEDAVAQTVRWYKAWRSGDDIAAVSQRQIEHFLADEAYGT